MTAIEFRGVRIELAGRTVLRDVSLAIRQGEFVGLLGPNGAGKTTFMRAVLGLLLPRSGSVHVLGQPARRGDPRVGYMPQLRAAGQTLRLSGWEFVAGVVDGHRLGLPLRGRAVAAAVDRVLALVGATGLARRPVAETSGGERQRLLLAQALVGQPQLLLLDEPLISLDPHHQQAIVALAKSLQRELGITVLFSSHELNPLLGALDRVLYLGGGAAALGTVEEVITGPVLSRLYGSPIDVVHVGRRIFVMSGAQEMGHDPHRHELSAPA